MELILIRHGRPERVEGAANGADPGLTEIGTAQAQAAADWLKHEHIDALYVSSMVRARETSAPIEAALGMEATVDDRVREYDAESSSYVPMEEVKADKDAWRRLMDYHANKNLTQFADTVMSALDEIIASHSGQRVAVVCHGGVINVAAARVLGLSDSMFFNPFYTSVNRMLCSSGGHRSIASLGDIGHLRHRPELRVGA